MKKIREIIEDNIYQEYCKYCSRQKECHDNCENCDDYYSALEKELNKIGEGL